MAHTPHLQQPEPGLDGDRRVAMATAHRILTWGPAGSAREREAWPQRDGWRAEDRGPGGPCGGRGCSVGQSRHTLLFIILLNGPNDLTRRPRAGKPTAAQRGGNSSGTSTPLPHPRPPALSAGLREVGEAGTSPLLPPLASTPTHLGSPAPSLCAAPGLALYMHCSPTLFAYQNHTLARAFLFNRTEKETVLGSPQAEWHRKSWSVEEGFQVRRGDNGIQVENIGIEKLKEKGDHVHTRTIQYEWCEHSQAQVAREGERRK